MNIVLIGYRGTGKTAIGKKLSKKLGWPLVQLDEMIARKEGRSIPEIVAACGWDYFRDIESKAVEKAARQDKHIIDTSGGVVLRQRNIDALKINGLLFWLTADPAVIIERIKDDSSRPSLTGSKSFIEEVQEVLEQRLPLYKKAADVTIDTAGKSVDSSADEIIKIYNKRLKGEEAKR